MTKATNEEIWMNDFEQNGNKLDIWELEDER